LEVTIKDVAKYAGVGIGTVSRVLNGEKAVNGETRERVLQAIKDLKYTPNQMAAKLRKNANKIIALLIPVIDHPFFAKFAYYVEDEADKYGYSILLVSSQQKIGKESEILSKIRRREVDGAVFVTHYEHDAKEVENCAIVSIDRKVTDGIPYVTSDNYASTKKAVEYLIEKGCKSIGYVGSKPLVNSEVMLRLDAYKDVMIKHGLESQVVNEIIAHGEERKVVSEFFDKYKSVDGVFVSGFTMAQAFCTVAKERGIKIPSDMQMISYDGSFRQWNGGVTMSCVEQNVEKMARTVVGLLISKINNKEVPLRTEIETEFIKGESTL